MCVSVRAHSGLTHEQQAVLVEVLVASVRQASEGPVLAGRTGAKKVRSYLCLRNKKNCSAIAKSHKDCLRLIQVMSTREKKLQTDDCTKLTHHFVITLPKLLSKVSWSSCRHWCIRNSFWRLTLFFFCLQFSSCCDALASLMKIPQYFLPECISTENTQVCFPVINHR